MENYPRTRFFLVFMSMALGAVIIGISSSLFQPAAAKYLFSFSSTFTAGGGDGGFATSINALSAAVAGGALMIVAAFPGLLGAARNLKGLIVIFILLSAIGSFVAIIGGAIFLNVPALLSERTYVSNRNDISPALVGLESDLSDFTLATYNECCSSRNWTAQTRAKPCTGSNTLDCPDITDVRVRDNMPGGGKILLCMCASSQSKLDQFQDAIRNSEGFCEAAAGALVNANGLKLPAKALSQNVQSLTAKYFTYKYDYIPIVGWYEVPSTNPQPQDSKPYPFGCGIGYQKGLAFMTDTWFQQNTVTPATAAIALGVVNLCLLLFGALVGLIAHDDASGAGTQADKWAGVTDVPANYAQTVPSQGLQLEHGSGSDGKGSHPDSLQMQNQQPPVAVFAQQFHSHNPQYSDPALFDKVSAFYGKYEPGKSVADVEDVTKWAHINGVEALNAKLQAKYQNDLTTFVASTGAENKGTKALAEDLDL